MVETWFKTSGDAREVIFSSHGGDLRNSVCTLTIDLVRDGSRGSKFSTLVYYCPEDRKEGVK